MSEVCHGDLMVHPELGHGIALWHKDLLMVTYASSPCVTTRHVVGAAVEAGWLHAESESTELLDWRYHNEGNNQ